MIAVGGRAVPAARRGRIRRRLDSRWRGADGRPGPVCSRRGSDAAAAGVVAEKDVRLATAIQDKKRGHAVRSAAPGRARRADRGRADAAASSTGIGTFETGTRRAIASRAGASAGPAGGTIGRLAVSVDDGRRSYAREVSASLKVDARIDEGGDASWPRRSPARPPPPAADGRATSTSRSGATVPHDGLPRRAASTGRPVDGAAARRRAAATATHDGRWS